VDSDGIEDFFDSLAATLLPLCSANCLRRLSCASATLLRVVIGTLNWRSQAVQISIAGTVPTHLSTLRFAFVMAAFSHEPSISYTSARHTSCLKSQPFFPNIFHCRIALFGGSLTVESSHDFALTCPLCNKPLFLKTDTCADENGKAVHENCYAPRIFQRDPPASPVAAA
jgi:hypothetical protein